MSEELFDKVRQQAQELAARADYLTERLLMLRDDIESRTNDLMHVAQELKSIHNQMKGGLRV